MALIVQKYGGTSVKDSERVKEVARWIVKNKVEGMQISVPPQIKACPVPFQKGFYEPPQLSL